MFSKIYSVGMFGITSHTITIESDISSGQNAFDIVGLPDNSVKESRDRVRSSIQNCNCSFPSGRVLINLAPSDLKKSGSVYDLPILVSILKASNQININLDTSVFIGQLSLNGEVTSVAGVLPMVIHAKEHGFRNIFIPFANLEEGSVVDGINVFGVKDVKELFLFLIGKTRLAPTKTAVDLTPNSDTYPDFSDVKGQFVAKRALEIAASGGHNALLIGPPGSGKSMLAKRLPSILPDMTFDEAIETSKIYSVANQLNNSNHLITTRPFRSPHHTISPAGLSGGGSIPKPGEISLSHNGVLFLDELPEFNKQTMEVLRQPIEDGVVSISRVNGTLSYPCAMMLIAAMNPCPCGYFGSNIHPCTCAPGSVSKYLAKVSGPLLDRIDLHIEAGALAYDSLTSVEKGESSAEIRARVNNARRIQQDRYAGTPITCNARLTPSAMKEFCTLSDAAQNILRAAFDTLGLSARAYDRILKVARTIADLDYSTNIERHHISEAIGYRTLDRKYWKNA